MSRRRSPRQIPKWLKVTAIAIGTASDAAWLFGIGNGVIFAVVAFVAGQSMDLSRGWVAMLVLGVFLLITSYVVLRAERRERERQKRLDYEEGQAMFGFMTAMTRMRNSGSNIREKPVRTLDWHGDLIEAGEKHVAFLARVKADRFKTTNPGYLSAKHLLVEWCRDLVTFASARGIDADQFRDFPEGWNWDDIGAVTEVIVANLAALKAVPRIAGTESAETTSDATR